MTPLFTIPKVGYDTIMIEPKNNTKSVDTWNIHSFDKNDIADLKQKLNLPDVAVKVLLAHGVTPDMPNLQSFLNTDESLLYTYDELSSSDQLKKGLRLLAETINKKGKVFINGDPDADGITATTIVVAVLLYFGVDVDYDFPIRAKEGHGLQCRLIDQCKENGVDLMITTDCGSKDFEAIQYAKDQGINVIVTDHHIMGETLPIADAIINPYLVDGDTYDKQLCGAGVIFKFMVALTDELDASLSEELFQFILAMAALGTLSDRMSLMNPMNRAIVREGVHYLNRLDIAGIIALKKISLGYIAPLKPREVSRTITPRLNAPGRIGDRDAGIPDSKMVVEMLLMGIEGVKKSSKSGIKKAMAQFLSVLETDRNQRDDAYKSVSQKADLIEDVNDQRRRITEKIDTEIEFLLSEEKSAAEHRIILVRGDRWNSGVIGIDTDRLRDRFKCPAVIVTDQGDSIFLKGSSRSIPKIDMYAVMDRVQQNFYEKHHKRLFQIDVETMNGSETVNAFGGHAQACGFSFHRDNYAEFEILLREEMEKIPAENFTFQYDIVDVLPFSKIRNELCSQLDKISPFGQRFDYPVFAIKNCRIGNKIRPFGNKYQLNRTPHVEFYVTDANPSGKFAKNPRYYLCVGFGLFEKFHAMTSVDKNGKFDIICSVDFQRGRGKRATQLQLNVQDIRPVE